MPWKVSDVSRFTKLAKTRKDKRAWVNVANSTLKTCLSKGGDQSECEGKAISTANGVIKRRKAKEMELSEAMTKTVNGKKLPASSFLVVEDPKKTSTWHLPVKDAQGKADHRLMGAAWAALHKGYRGSKYSGPNKSQATSKLKALYKSEKLDTPSESYEVEDMDNNVAEVFSADELGIAEYYDTEGRYHYTPSNVYTFADLEAVEATEQVADEINEMTGQFLDLVRNIVWWFEGDKPSAIRSLSNEFADRLDELLPPGDNASPEAEEKAYNFEEAEAVSIINIKEHDPEQEAEADTSDAPLEMTVQIIQPGWGNKADNHYYPEEVVRRDAEKFINAKMYTTDHNDNERSVRTWVSTIKGIEGFTETGAPIGRVVVFDPGFAKVLRNLKKKEMLSDMACSIYASGRAVGGFELDGRKGKRITEFVDVGAVDWVTRAGAGGRALELSENSKVGGDMNKKPDEKTEAEVEETTAVETEQEQPVAITEAGTEDQPAAEETTDEAPEAAEQEDEKEETPEPETLSQEEVDKVLASTALPAPAVERLASQSYSSLEKLKETVDLEVKYIETLTGAGHPVAMGESHQHKSLQNDPAKVEEAAQRVIKKHIRR